MVLKLILWVSFAFLPLVLLAERTETLKTLPEVCRTFTAEMVRTIPFNPSMATEAYLSELTHIIPHPHHMLRATDNLQELVDFYEVHAKKFAQAIYKLVQKHSDLSPLINRSADELLRQMKFEKMKLQDKDLRAPLSQHDQRWLFNYAQNISMRFYGAIGELRATLFFKKRLADQDVRIATLPDQLAIHRQPLPRAAPAIRILRERLESKFQEAYAFRYDYLKSKNLFDQLQKKYPHLITIPWEGTKTWGHLRASMSRMELDGILVSEESGKIHYGILEVKSHSVRADMEYLRKRQGYGYHSIMEDFLKKREFLEFLGLEKEIALEAYFPSGLTHEARTFFGSHDIIVHEGL